MATSDRNIYARIQQAYKTIAAKGFTKDGQVKGAASYKFISIGQILEAVRKAQADAGITVIFGRPEYDHDNHEKRWEFTKKSQFGESTWYAAVGHISVTLYGADADDFIQTEIPFEAQDNSDKLDNKIVTNIERQAYRVLYAIDEGDATDPESEWREDMVTGAELVRSEAPKGKRPEYKTPTKAATPGDPEKDKIINDLTAIIMSGGTDCDVIMSMLNGRTMNTLGTIELKQIYEAVHPFEQRGGKA